MLATTNFNPQFPNGPPAGVQGNPAQNNRYGNLFNNANYNNYYNGTTPYLLPSIVQPPPMFTFQDFLQQMLSVFNEKLEFVMAVMGLLWDSQPEVENSYLMSFPVFIQHLGRPRTAGLTTIQGLGKEVQAAPLKQVTLKQPHWLTFTHKVKSYDFASGTGNTRKAYIMAILEGMMMISRRVIIQVVEALIESYNYLDNLNKDELLVLADNNVRGIGILNQKDRMLPVSYITKIVRTVMASSPQDLILVLYPQEMTSVMVNSNKYGYTVGQDLLEQNLSNPDFITVEKSDVQLFGGNGLLRLVQSPVISTFNEPKESIITYSIFRMCYVLNGDEVDAGKALIPAGNYKMRRINPDMIKLLIFAGMSPAEQRALPGSNAAGVPLAGRHILYIQSEIVCEGHPIMFAGTSNNGGPKPLQAFQGHPAVHEGDLLGTLERQYTYQRTLRVMSKIPDIVRIVGSAGVSHVFMNNDFKYIPYTPTSGNEIAVLFKPPTPGQKPDHEKFLDNQMNSGSDFVSWYSIDQFIGAVNAANLKGTTANWVTTHPVGKDDDKDNYLHISINNSNAQTGCLLGKSCILTEANGSTATGVSYPSDMTDSFKSIFPVLFRQPITFEEMKAQNVSYELV